MNRRLIGIGPLLLAALWGGMLTALAARPFAAELLAAGGSMTAGDPPAPQPADPLVLARQADRLDRALAISPEADIAERAALVRQRLADAYGRQSDWGRREAERARELAGISLGAAPGNPFLWLWLSQLDADLDGVSARSARAWLASVRAGPTDPDLAENRLWLGLAQADAFDETERAALAEQILGLAAWRMHDLVSAALRADATAAVRRVLAADPARLAGFNAGVARSEP